MGKTLHLQNRRLKRSYPMAACSDRPAYDSDPPPENSKRSWSAAEDQQLIDLVGRFGANRWPLIASHMPHRVGKQCRERWFQHLRPEVKKGSWTSQEDQTIENAVLRFGQKWTQISQLLPGRTDNAVKNRYNSNLRKRQRMQQQHETGPELPLQLPSQLGEEEKRVVQLTLQLVNCDSELRSAVLHQLLPCLHQMAEKCHSEMRPSGFDSPHSGIEECDSMSTETACLSNTKPEVFERQSSRSDVACCVLAAADRGGGGADQRPKETEDIGTRHTTESIRIWHDFIKWKAKANLDQTLHC